jgi:hypothetical protein
MQYGIPMAAHTNRHHYLFFIMKEDRANLNVTSQVMAKKKCWIIGYNGDIDQIKLNESNLVVEEMVKSLFNPR